MNTPLERAIEIVGGKPRLAETLGITLQAVCKWHSLNRIPPARVLQIEQATGGQVSRHELRPDIFGPA